MVVVVVVVVVVIVVVVVVVVILLFGCGSCSRRARGCQIQEDDFGFGMVLSALREPPKGSVVFYLPYIRQLKVRVVETTVAEAAAAPVYDKATRQWTVRALAAQAAGAGGASGRNAEVVRTETCPTGDAGLRVCDVVAAVNWAAFHGRGSRLLTNDGNKDPAAPNLVKFAAISVLRMVRAGRQAQLAHVDDALRHFRIFCRRRTQLLDAIRHLLRTSRAGFLVRAVHDASFMPSLVRDDPLYALGLQLLARKRKWPSSSAFSEHQAAGADAGAASASSPDSNVRTPSLRRVESWSARSARIRRVIE